MKTTSLQFSSLLVARSLLCLVCLIASASKSTAANVTWNGASSSSFFGPNWTSTTTPATSTYTITGSDIGNFADVGSGTQIVNVNSTGTVQTLSFTQTTPGGLDEVVINAGDTLFITKGNPNVAGSVNGGAGNVAAGTAELSITGTLAIATASASTPNFYNTYVLNSGGTINSVNTSTTTATNFTDTFDGTVDANAGTSNFSTIEVSGTGTSGTAASNFVFAGGSALNVQSGELDIERATGGTGAAVNFTGASGSTINVASGSTLGIINNSSNKVITFSNAGSLTQSGTINLENADTSTATLTDTFTNSGTWTISGANAVLGQTRVSGTTTAIALSAASSGLIQGATSADTLTYSNSLTGAALPLAVTGTIAPGGAGSVGKLTVGNINLGLASTAALAFDVNGSSSGQYDVLTLSGTGANLALSVGSQLDVTLGGGFTPSSSFSLQILNYAAETGTLALYVNGVLNPADYSIAYGANSAELNFTAGGATSGTYTLTETVGINLLHMGATTTATTTLANTGTGSADSLDYSGLGVTAGTGSVTGSPGTGGPVAQGGTGTATQTYIAETVGTDTLTPTVSTATGATGSGVATNAGTTTATITVYSGVGVWTGTTTSASWGTTESTAPANWTATGGIPGITPGFITTDSASFGNSIGSNSATVNLAGASPFLNNITFNNTLGGSYTIAQGGTGTIHLYSTGTATIVNTSGNNAISAPVELDAPTADSVAASSTLTISGNISQGGGQGFAINGPGTTILSGSNSYTGGTTVNTGATLLANNASGSATGSGLFTLAGGATLGGTGAINTSQFVLGSASAAQASVIVGNGTDTTSKLTLTGSGSNTITNVALNFNISATTAGQSNVLNVGTSQITFSNTVLELNIQGAAWISAYTPYLLVQGTGTNQYVGLTTTEETLNGTQYNVITDPSALELAWGQSYASSAYANSVLILNTADGADDIEILVVPEPSTWALMLGGLCTLLVIARRRRCNSGQDSK